MGNRQIIETPARNNSKIKIRNRATIRGEGILRSRVALSIPANGHVIIKTDADAHTKVRLKVRRRTRIKLRRA